MPYDFVVDQDRQMLWVRYSGAVTIAERQAAAEHAFAQTTGSDVRRFLLDYRSATSSTTNDVAGSSLARYIAAQLEGRNARVAWLVNYDHQLDPLVEGRSRELGVANERFLDFDEAVAWLQRSEPAEAAGAAKANDAPFRLPEGFGSLKPHLRMQGTFEVAIAQQASDNPPAREAAILRLSLDKRYSGPLDAQGQGEMLADGGGDRKDGAYVAMERVTGALEGRKGSFALVHRALMRNGAPEGWSVVIVPGSGTGALAGLEGSMRISIDDGKHHYDLDYTLPG
jgi:hypothetical protein